MNLQDVHELVKIIDMRLRVGKYLLYECTGVLLYLSPEGPCKPATLQFFPPFASWQRHGAQSTLPDPPKALQELFLIDCRPTPIVVPLLERRRWGPPRH
jgi:hypothetical protein